MNPAEMSQVENATKQGISVEKKSNSIDRKVSVAPMMDWTDRHCRYFLRGFSPHILLYTEMITAEALLRGDATRLLRYSPEEHPVALQLGGSEPARLAAAARLGVDAGYDEINLNCGCPSDRVHAGAFGACLMEEPARVAECVAAMRAVVRVPVTVKMRIGVLSGRGAVHERLAQFEEADFQRLVSFARGIVAAGCTVLIVHARQAVLGGLSPKDNREVPPLRYEVVRRLKQEFPEMPVVLNGGVRTVTHALAALEWCDGVMLGREAYHRPQVLHELHTALWPEEATMRSARELLERMARYAASELARGERLSAIARHLLGLGAGQAGARDFRRLLSEGMRESTADATLLSALASRV